MSGRRSAKRGAQGAPDHSSAFDLHLLSALRDTPATHFSVRQPWDASICSDASARKRFMPGLPAPQRLLPPAVPEREASHPEAARMQSRLDAAGAKFARRTKHVSWDAKETEEKNFALFKWLKIIERGPWDFAVSRDFLRARLLGLGAGDLLESISNALAAKSTATLHTRAGPMIRYLAFCDLEGIEPFPIREEVMYKFFYDMQTQVAATFFKSVLSSLAFGRFVLGLDSAVLALDSLRVKGLARKLYLGIRRLQQRPPLRVKDVIRLELICTGDIPRSALDVVMAGFVLFMVFARARHSDAQHVSLLSFELDFRGELPAGFINAEVKKTKTSFTVERKTKFLPMLAPARGLSGKCWASGWKAALEKENITAGEGKPLMPSPKSGGGWNVIPQTAQASGQWMRALLSDGTDDPYLLGLGTHSAKATLLSQLHAAFDGREEAAELIEVFLPGINRDGKYQRADVLVAWAQENESAIKRQRRESLHGMWEVLPQQRVVPKLTDTFDELARSNPLVLLPALQRKRRLLKENTDATQRAKEEQLARKKYALHLAEILKEAKLPLVQQLEGVDRPEEVWPRIFGTRRSKTLRNRLKAWQPFRTWLQCVHEVQWPTSVRQLIDYSNERFQSECGKTVLNSFQASLAVLEQVGKVAETQRLSSDTTWLAHLKSLTADLVGEQAPVQQAPMMTVAMIISLELHIAREDEPEYIRAMAFVALLAVYGSMRMDDLQGMLPATMQLTAQGFRATLGRTKTTGADRRNKEVSVFIHRQAGLSGFDWLGEGFALWKKYTQPRDFLVMIARDDWKGPTKHFAKSEVVAGYVREVFKRLATPKFEDGAYRLNLQRYLLVEGAQGFFTGHSPRNWLTSAAAVLGWSKDQRDFLGRWMIGGSGSADYTRTAREVVHRIQIGVCEAIVTGKGGEYQESEALEELKAFVDERGGSGALARRRHDLLRTVEGVRCLGSKWPAIEQDDADASEEEEAPEAMNVEGSATKYFISISRKTGHRRLHLNGPCHVKPHHCNRVEFVERVALDQIDSICRDCKHRMREDQGAEDDQDTSSESGSTSDSSSEEGQLRRTVSMFVIVSDPRFSVSADQRAEVAKMDSDLQYVLQEASASLATQYQVARLHQSRRRFQAIADNREGARTAARDFGINPDTPAGRVEVAAIVAAWELAKEYASKEIELRAEAKVLGHKRILQVQERQAMLKAVTDAYGKMNESETPSAEYLATKAEECESNEPLASSLDRISSKKDSQVESLQTSIDPTGHVRVTKTMQKLEMPHHSEGYRRLMKVEAHAWLCMSARFKVKAWLQGLQLDDFTKFVEYILGDRVGNLKLPTASGQETQFNRPPWNIVLSYEYKLRVEAFKMILEGTATMAEALRAVREDPSLKEAYFTTPLALHTAGTPTKFRKGNSKGKDKQQGQEIPPPPAPHQNGCFGEHPASQHEAATAGQPVASRVVHVFADPAERFDWAPHLSNSLSQPEFVAFGFDANNLFCGDAWDQLFELVKQPKTVILISPPYDTFSRARHKQPGPPPLRSDQWPRGFPWLKDSSMQKVTSANHFIDQCLKATIFAAEAGNFFMWEAPEHFGRTADGIVPSSIWVWPELLDCIPRFAATTFVHYLCEFGADWAKPTRYLSNLPFFRHSPRPLTGLPVLDADHRYVGPLPASCPHGGHAISTGKSPTTQQWNLPRARGWPPQLCQFMVAAIDFSLQADGECKSSKSKVPDKAIKVPDVLVGHAKEPPRESISPAPGRAFATGAYCKGGLVGLRHHSTAMPMSTRVLTKYLQQVAPGFQASAIAIFDDVRTGVHRDARNAHYPNMVVPLSDFEGGQIWLEQQGGDVWETTPEGQRPGVLLEVCKGPVSFDAWRSYHATRAWKGRRVVMVAYMTDKLGNVEASDLVHLKALGFELPLDLDASNGETSEALGTAEGPSTQDTAPPVPFRPEACGNRGNPIRVEWEGQEADMTDGFGLCSPSRWRPMDRGHRLGPAATAHAQSMYRMLTSFIAEHVPDPRRFCLSLLSGKVESSPFAGEKLEALRKQWAKVLGAEDSPDVLEIPDAQPFLLRALSLSAERLEDPDWEILTEGVDCFCTGVPLGLNCDIPHLPQVYERKCQWRKLDESELEFDRENYKSAELSSAGLLEKFRAEEKLGRMKPTTLGALREEYSDDMIRVASMGAILKPDGSVRPLHDGTHGVNVNNQIRLVNQLAVPGPAEMSFSVRQSGAMQEIPLAATADVSAAHRLVLHRKRYELDYGARLVGLSEARGAWVCNWVDEARKARFVVSVRKFAEFLGRLGFVSRVVYWIKPHLAPLYAWSAAASKSHVAKMPDTVILTLLYLEATLKDINFKVTPGRQQEEKGHLFHTDAKCDDGYVVLGGWDSSQDLSVASWFSIVVKPADAPYLFDAAGKSQWASASAELLATLAALWFFGHLKESSSQRRLPVAVAGATDNQSNEKLLKKQSTTKWPLMLINMQLSHLLRKACLRLSLTWKPRDENKLADALTNQDFSSFSSEHRLDVSFSELPLELLNQLWLSKSDFDGKTDKKGVARDVTALLGYHATKDAGIGTEIIYARDAMAYPLRVLQELVDEVRDRSFRPDETRGLMTAAEREAAGVRDDAGADCSSSSSEDEAVMARNETSRVLHISREEQATAFICGRKITAAYEVLRAEGVDNPKFRAHAEFGTLMMSLNVRPWGGSEAVTKLKAAGINTLAKVAFVSSYAPGAASDAELIKVLNEALGKESDAGQKASWRRLFHEAYAVATQELKTMAERPDEAGPRRLSQPERAERYRKIKASVSGIDIKDRNEPSDALLDLCVGIYEGNRLRYVSWDRCTSKSQELSSEVKRDNMLTVDAQGRLKAEAKGDHIKADTSSEILLQFALLRRGLAFEMSNLLDFRLHRRWAEKLIETRMAAQLDTHSQVSFAQLEAADQKFFQELADRTRDGVQATAVGRPLDDCFEEVFNLPEVGRDEVAEAEMPSAMSSGQLGVGLSKRARSRDRAIAQVADSAEGSDSESSIFAAEHVASAPLFCKDPEQFSATASLKKPLDLRDVVTLCDLLESEIPARGNNSEDEFSWSTGAYVHGGVHGCRQHMHQFPVTSAFLAKVFKEYHPRLPVTTLSLTRNVRTTLHLDANNALGYLNGLVKISGFSGGGLWVQDSSGSIVCPTDPSLLGSHLDFSDLTLAFDPHKKHLTLPWTQGPRIVLIGFVVKAPAEIPDQAAEMPFVSLRQSCKHSQDSSALARLQSANRIFIQLGAFLLRARELEVPFSLMHPMSSWLWELPPFADLLKVTSEAPVYLVSDLHRIQHLRLVYTLCDLSPLSAADRADAVPAKLFCDRFAAALSTQVAALGLGPSPLSLPEVRAAAQNQPKASKLPPLVPEFAYTQRLRCAGHPPLDAKNQLTHSWNGVPKHARLLRSSASEGGATEESAQQATNISLQKPRHTEYVFGVYREPVQFVYQAVALQHPFDAARALPDKLVRVLFDTLTKGPLCIMRNRLLLLQKWNQWAKDLRSDEAALQASLHPSVRKVLQGKKLLLLDKIAKSLDWPDKHLHRDLCAGFKLSGTPDPTGVFEPDHKPALSSEEQFWDAAEVLKHQLWARVREQPAQEYDAELAEITLGETGVSGGKGWLEGPLSFSELQERFEGQWMPCRRFAVWQNKWRPIDDLSESGLNATFGCHEKIPLRALDEVVWICTKIMQAASARGDVTLHLSSGETLKGKLHDHWTDKEKIRPVTTTFDLKSAYKQLPLAPEEQSKAIVTIRHPSQTEPSGYICNTLPFGACGSVLHFNRVSALLRRIMLEMEILTALYYDDYPVVTPSLLGNSTAAAFTSVMSQAIAAAIEEIITRGHVAPRELPSLFGRLQFAEAQILGRMGRLAIHDLRSLERCSAARVNLTAQHLEALLLLKERVVSGAPRTVSASAATSPIVIFTDGCFEPDAANPAGVGGVMFAPSLSGGLKVRAFGSLVPKTLLEAWHAKGKRHLIGQVEMFAVIIARSCWANVLDGARVIYFVDHSGVLAACISGSSKEDTWRKLLCALEKADSLPALQWFSRVPSHSNISDGPSRGRWEGLLRAFPECAIDVKRGERSALEAKCIAGPNWLDLWHEARMEVGLTEFVPPLPTPGPAGEPTGASVSTEEMSLWLQKIFVDRGSLRTSGHTLKRTFLTMATKRGVEHLDRLVLGGHANSAGMADTYGDDELARPLRLLMALISEIREGVFDPDAGRAGYLRGSGLEELRLGFAAQTDDRHPPSAESWERVTGDDDMFGLVDALDKGAPSQPDVFFPGDDDADLMGQDSADEPPEAEVGDGGVSSLGAEDDKLVGKDSDSSSSSGSSDSSDSSGSDDEPARIMPPPEPAVGTTFLQHQRTRLLHMIADNNRRVLMCGRMVSSGGQSLVRLAGPSELHFGSDVKTSDRPTQAEMDAFAVKILGAAPRLGDVSILKRLMFESATYVIAQLRQAVQGDSAEQPRKLPLAEKQARAEDQRRRLSGVHIERDLVPSHALVDLCCHMHDVGITWISPGKCTSRESEIQLSTKDQSKIFRLEDNSLKVGSEQPKDIASYDSPIKLQWCLQRRGLALDQAKVLTWAQHERWVHCLLHALTKECPPGFHKPDMNRIVQADREAWLILASEVPSLKPSTAGEYPLGKALDALRFKTLSKAPLPNQVKDCPEPPSAVAVQKRPRLRETYRAALGVSMFVLTVAVWATPSVIAELALGRAAAISGYGPHSVGFHFSPAATSEVADVLAPAEAIALQCLQAGFASHDDFRSLIALLPADTAGAPSEESVDPTAPKSFTSGAYVHQAKAGLRSNFHAFPFSTMLLAAVLSASFGSRCFSSVGLFLNLKAPLHNDANNDHAHPNLILPASVFHKGQIWVEGKGECPCPDPDVPRLGYLLPVADGPQLLPSERLRATCDWDGTRLLIVGFCIRDTGLLSEAHRVRLLDARFLLPQVESGSASDAVLPVPPPKRPKEAFPQRATPLVIEIFAGTARLSTACQKLGFRTLAIDKSTARGRFPIQRLDLTDADDLCILLDIIRLEAANIVWIHCAPPCGTASAARSRPIPELTAAGVRVPQPLRSTSEPQGLSTLTGADLERVQKANMLYRAVGQIADLARQLNIFVTVENPRNSLAWLCDGLDELFRSPHHTVVYDACMHGGTRDKTTLLWCSADWFQPLALRCSRDHQHTSWKPRLQPHATSFPTADEAAYPVLLCERMAHIIAARAGGLALAAPDPRPFSQVYLQRQPRFARPLVACYSGSDDWAIPVRSDDLTSTLLACYPKGARIIQRKLVSWGMVRVCVPSKCTGIDLSSLHSKYPQRVKIADCIEEDHLKHDETVAITGFIAADDPCSEHAEIVSVGIPKEPCDFVADAVKAGHPRNALNASREGPSSKVADAILMDFERRERLASKTKDRWSQIAATTKPLNHNMLKHKPDYIVTALGDKNLLAWKSILGDNGFPDQQLWSDLRDGLRLTGWMRDTGIFDKKVRPPQTSLEHLLSQSQYQTPLTLKRLQKTVVDITARKAWAETVEEEKKGWIFRDESANLDDIVLAHRFGLQQKDKVRVIDNGKECGLNLACGLPEKFTLHGVDVLAGVFIELLNRPEAAGKRIKGKTIDLVSAYKFYPIHPQDRRHLRIGVYDTDSGMVRIYGTNVLPFGATGSVAGFLRVSAAIWHTGIQDLGLGWCAYFDDFPLMALEGHEDQVGGLAGEVFDALGIQYAKEGKKATDFDYTFAALGLQYDLTRFNEGVVVIRHTEARTAELVETLEGILRDAVLRPKDAEVLRGRMHWFTSYLFGRAPCEAMRQISLGHNVWTHAQGSLTT
ncbi:unnamed protein product [Symbiodinium sp. CCMP2592]|nr:unnamed protein product [Symbiodinium sp. CCMP2592]